MLGKQDPYVRAKLFFNGQKVRDWGSGGGGGVGGTQLIRCLPLAVSHGFFLLNDFLGTSRNPKSTIDCKKVLFFSI